MEGRGGISPPFNGRGVFVRPLYLQFSVSSIISKKYHRSFNIKAEWRIVLDDSSSKNLRVFGSIWVQMTGNKSAIIKFLQIWLFYRASIESLGTSGMETASTRRINGAGYFASWNLLCMLNLWIRNRNCANEPFSIGMQRFLVNLVLVTDLNLSFIPAARASK